MQKPSLMRRFFCVQALSDRSDFETFKQPAPVVLQPGSDAPQKCKPPQMVSSAAAAIYKKQASRICMRGKAFLWTAAAVTSAARPLVFLLIIHHMQKGEMRNLSFRYNMKHLLRSGCPACKQKLFPNSAGTAKNPGAVRAGTNAKESISPFFNQFYNHLKIPPVFIRSRAIDV